MHVVKARLTAGRSFAARAAYSCGVALLLFLIGSRGLQNAVAEGDTRTITMHHVHTGEDITITYKRDGRYDEAALKKLDWFLRDWRRSEATSMDPRLLDLVWEVQRETGSAVPIEVVCGYRSPQTNAMLRRRSEGVARFSQHMLGRAMDFYIPGISLEKVREIGLRLARGGVGFYPESGSPFVHMDVGGIRMWPRMTHDELARVFPDGRTVQIPTDGKPLPGYAVALAEVRQHGATPSANSLEAARNAGVDVGPLLAGTELASNAQPTANPFTKLIGLARDDEDEDADAALIPVSYQSKPVVLAGLDATAAKKPTITRTVAAKVERAIDKLKLVHIAKILPTQPASADSQQSAPDIRPIPNATAQTPNQIIAARGYWEGPPDGMAVANPLAEVDYRRTETAAAGDPGSTGAIHPLAYAQQDGQANAATSAAGIAALRAAALAAVHNTAPAKTTVAVKRAADQIASAIITASSSSMTVVRDGARVANPWLRALVLSPSVKRFLTTAALGDRDFRSLAALLIKPRRAVVMTFATDPNPGLSQDRFSGPAIAFVSTVNYAAATHTASLQ
ncbi:MAG TPA: DUF882 domain-containing protein [Xanthobacteraceae bacterium]|nr:DUF882 domain-containing protein [Xanthobacteraceae bacterium]